MKKIWYLIWICLLCLMLAGCRSTQDTLPPAEELPTEEVEDAVLEQEPDTQTTQPAPEELPSGETEDASQQQEQQPDTQTTQPVPKGETDLTLPDVVEDGILKSNLTVENTGKMRIQYKGNQSSIQYVTSVSQLPDYEQFKAYDDAYFQDHALLLITETVSSGSVQVGIDTIALDGATGTVTLSHHMSGEYGTTDMATWLLWVEVDSGLDYQWIIANPALPTDSASY